nr:uncharacterized protein LOC113719035 isoform X1 [Coffea arabica]
MSPQHLIICTSCQRQIRVEPRCRLTVNFANCSGSMTLDLYGQDAEQLLPFTIAEIQDQEEQGSLDYKAIEESINSSMIVCFVKKTEKSFASSSTEKYTAIIAHKLNLGEIEARGLPPIYTDAESSTAAETAAMHAKSTTAPTENTTNSSGDHDNKLEAERLATLKITESPTKKQKTTAEKVKEKDAMA